MSQKPQPGYGKKAIILTVSILILILATNNGFEAAFNKLGISAIEKQNEQFLESSMQMAMGYFAGLGALKGTLAVLSEIEISIPFIAGIKAGQMLSAVKDTVDQLWQFFGYSMISILSQMTLLKFFKFFSMNILIPLGAILYGAGVFHMKLIRKFGIMMLAGGFLLYLAMPLTIFSSQLIMNNIAMEETVSLNEKIAILDIKTKDIQHSNKDFFTKQFESMKENLSGNIDIMTNAAARQIAILFTVFILTPFLFYGLLYVSLKGFQLYLTGNEDAPDRLEEFLIAQTSHGLAKVTGSMQTAVQKITQRKKT